MLSNLRIYAAHLVPVLVLALSGALLFVHAPHLLEGTGLLRWILVSITLSWLLWYSACRILRPIKQEARDWVRSVHSVVGIAYASLVLALAWDFRAAPAHTVRYPEDELLTLDYVSSRIVSHEHAGLSIVRDGTRVNAPSSRIVCVADEYGATPTEVAAVFKVVVASKGESSCSFDGFCLLEF